MSSTPSAQECAAQAKKMTKEFLDAGLEAKKVVLTFIKTLAPDFVDADTGENMWKIITDPTFDSTYDPSVNDLLNMMSRAHRLRLHGRTFNIQPVEGKSFITPEEWASMVDLADAYQFPVPSDWSKV